MSARTESAARHALRTVALLIGAILAWMCLASSGPIQFSDNGILVAGAAEGPLLPAQVFATIHPTYSLVATSVARLLGPVALAYLNPALGLLAAGATYALGRELSLTARASYAGALTFLLAHATFWVGTKAEVYMLHAALLLWTLVLLLRAQPKGEQARAYAFAAGMLAGLAVGTHQLTLILAPSWLWLVLSLRARIPLFVAGALLGLTPLTYGIVHELAGGMGAAELARAFLFGEKNGHAGWGDKLLSLDGIGATLRYVALASLSLLGMQLVGILRPKLGSPTRLSLYACALLNVLFALSYGVPDRFQFLLPGIAIGALLGAERIEQWLRARFPDERIAGALLALSFGAPVLLCGAYAGMQLLGMRGPRHERALAGRDDIKYFMVPYLGDDSGARFVSTYLAHVPEGSTVFADFSPLGAFEAARVTGRLGRYHITPEQRPCSQVASGGFAYTPRADYPSPLRERLEPIDGGYRLRCP